MPKLKSLFETPKKTAVTVVCLLVIMVMLGTVCVYASTAIAQSSSIGADMAANYAYADAGVDPASALGLRTKFEFEDGQFVYDVEFIANGVEYDYLIRASDGAVLKREQKTVSAPAPSGGGGITLSKTLEEARDIALADAGLAEADVLFTKAELDRDNGLWVYELDFHSGSASYEYEINANTGDIYSKSVKTYLVSGPSDAPAASPEQTQPAVSSQAPATQAPATQAPATQAPATQAPATPAPATPTPAPATPTPATPAPVAQPSAPQPPAAQISLEEAKSAALSDAGIAAADAIFSKAQPDYEDGILVYDIEFCCAGREYDYEINAATGAVYSRSMEACDHPNHHQSHHQGGSGTGSGGSGGTTYIGVDQAKTIALNHAGLSASQVFFTKAELDWDDGIAVYEIEFRQGQMEYEYEINAATGAIREYDWDWD